MHIINIIYRVLDTYCIQITSVVLTPLTLVNKGQVKARSVNLDWSVNGVNEVNVTCVMAHVASAPQV